MCTLWRKHCSVDQEESQGVQAIVQPGLYYGFSDIQMGGDLACRPAQVVRLTNHLTMRRAQLVEGFADRYAIEQLVHVVGSGRVDPPEPTSVTVRGHESMRLS